MNDADRTAIAKVDDANAGFLLLHKFQDALDVGFAVTFEIAAAQSMLEHLSQMRSSLGDFMR